MFCLVYLVGISLERGLPCIFSVNDNFSLAAESLGILLLLSCIINNNNNNYVYVVLKRLHLKMFLDQFHGFYEVKLGWIPAFDLHLPCYSMGFCLGQSSYLCGCATRQQDWRKHQFFTSPSAFIPCRRKHLIWRNFRVRYSRHIMKWRDAARCPAAERRGNCATFRSWYVALRQEYKFSRIGYWGKRGDGHRIPSRTGCSYCQDFFLATGQLWRVQI